MNNKNKHIKNIVIIYSNDSYSFAIELQSLFKDDVIHCYCLFNGVFDNDLIIGQNTDFIVVLLSNDMLIQKNIEEVQKIYYNLDRRVDNNQSFCPYVIQKNLQSSSNWPQWIEGVINYIPRFFRSPYMIIKDLEEKHRKHIWRENPFIRVMESTFVGRTQEIGVFQSKYYSSRGYNYKALIISGREGVGKDMFARYCLNQMGFSSEYEPYSINLGRSSSIENFILQLNSIERLFSIADLKEKLSGSTIIKVNIAVDLLNEVYDAKDVLFVEDAGACILPQREPAQWLVDIIKSTRLKFVLGLFVKSKFIPRPTIENEYLNIAHINLGPLSVSDRKQLFYLFYRSFFDNLDICDEDVDYFVNKLYYSPNQLMAVVTSIYDANGNVKYVKEHLDGIISMGDKMARPILQLYDNKPDDREEYQELLYILSKFEYVSFDILKKVFNERYKEILNMISYLIVYGVVELFGQSDEYIRLDHYICDYINRNHMKISRVSTMAFNDAMRDLLKDNTNMTEDVSLYLYETRKRLEKYQINDIPENYLIPSIVLKVVMDKYNGKHYDDVIILCNKTLDDGYHYYEEIRQELRYWQCAAICHIQDAKNFVDKLDDIKEIALKRFLQGLYARCGSKYIEGEKFYKEAIQKAPGMGKAKRELVMCLMGQDKYMEALPLARENYEQNKENVYYCQTYFRCLIRKQDIDSEDIDVLDTLMNTVKYLKNNNQESLVAAMKIDYMAYVEKASQSQVVDYIQQMEKRYPNSQLIKRIGDDYKIRNYSIQEADKTEEDWSL